MVHVTVLSMVDIENQKGFTIIYQGKHVQIWTLFGLDPIIKINTSFIKINTSFNVGNVVLPTNAFLQPNFVEYSFPNDHESVLHFTLLI